jgi:2-haloacid dehalogenase
MRYDVIMMDIDNTLLDFDAGTRDALTEMLAAYGLELTGEREKLFHAINNRLWKQYELGEIPKAAIFEQRFGQFLRELGISCDALAENARYAKLLSQSAVFIPHCPELLEALKGKCRLIGVTNGVVTTQKPRLEKAGFARYLEQVFVSEAMGCKKPEKEFFDKVFAAIGPVDKSRCLILGDSLSSDMQGGRNAGIATCYYGSDPDDRCDYAITDLLDLLPIVEG